MWRAAVGMAASTSLRQDLAVPAGYAVVTRRCTQRIYMRVYASGGRGIEIPVSV